MTTSKEKKKDANAEMRELIKVGQTIFGLDIQILLNEIFLALNRRAFPNIMMKILLFRKIIETYIILIHDKHIVLE